MSTNRITPTGRPDRDEQAPLRFALFSDVHGRLRVVLHMLRCWQIAHWARLDGALIAGDLGCFPDPTRFDRATRRWVEKDPEEAGFSAYFAAMNPTANAYFEETKGQGPFSKVSCPIFFVPGNHEDYDHIEACATRKEADGAPEGTFPVDAYESIHCIRDGEVVAIGRPGGPALRIGGLWGIEKTSETENTTSPSRAVRSVAYGGQQPGRSLGLGPTDGLLK